MVQKKRVGSERFLIKSLINSLGQVIVGHEDVVKASVRSVIIGGHLLVSGLPGSAKTLLARSIAKSFGVTPSRIQGSSELEKEDVFGFFSKSKFVKGPIFNQFVVIDQLNRVKPQTQSLFLESLEEHQVSVRNQTLKLSPNQIIVATMNTFDYSVYPIIPALLDRFMFCVEMGYPILEEEYLILHSEDRWNPQKAVVGKKFSFEDLLKVRKAVNKIYISTDVSKYILRIINATRYPKHYHISNWDKILIGSSSRGAVAMMLGAKVDAMIEGKDFVTPQNVKNVIYDSLRHRIVLTREGLESGLKVESIIDEILRKIPLP